MESFQNDTEIQGLTRDDFLILGIGGGGANTVSNMALDPAEGPVLVAVHTDADVLAACAAPQRVQLGVEATGGFSTGGDPVQGRRAAEGEETKLKALLADKKIVFLVTALGGGTGTGAAPVIARFAREEGALVLSFVTLPFQFEGDTKRKTALGGLSEMKRCSDTVICMPNDRLLQGGKGKQPVLAAFKDADEAVGKAVRALWTLVAHADLINLSLSELRNLALHSGGTCSFACASAKGKKKVTDAVKALLESPSLEQGHVLAQAKGLLIAITGDPGLTLNDIQRSMKEIRAMAPVSVHSYFGAAIDETLQNEMQITLLVAEEWVGDEQPVDEAVTDEPAMLSPADEAQMTLLDTDVDPDKSSMQIHFDLEPAGRGRFSNVEPTYIDGQDLDIPTFVRRGIPLSSSGRRVR